MAKVNRTTLKEYFRRGNIPRQAHFEDLIDSVMNQEEDGFSKNSAEDPLQVVAGENGGLLLFSDFVAPGNAVSHFKLSLTAGQAAPKKGLNFSDAAGNSLLYLDSGTGRVGIGTTDPGAKLEVAGSLKARTIEGNILIEKFHNIPISPGNKNAGPLFGRAVASNGSIVAVGSPSDSEAGFPYSGAVYLYELVNGDWAEVGVLRPDDPFEDQYFGLSVAIQGQLIVVGAPGDLNSLGIPDWEESTEHQFVPPSSVYVFRYNNNDPSWVQVTKLEPPTGNNFFAFGHGLTISGTPGDEAILIGAYYSRLETTIRKEEFFSGAVVECSGQDFGDVQIIALDTPVAGDLFGRSFAVSGENLLVGAPTDNSASFPDGKVYYFQKQDDSTWQFQQEIQLDLPPAIAALNSSERSDIESGRSFGFSIAMEGNLALISAPSPGEEGEFGPAGAYLFELIDNNWIPYADQPFIENPDPGLYSLFGIFLVLQNNKMAIGSYILDEDEMRIYHYILNDSRPVNRFLLSDFNLPGDAQYSGLQSAAFHQDVFLAGVFNEGDSAEEVGAVHFTRKDTFQNQLNAFSFDEKTNNLGILTNHPQATLDVNGSFRAHSVGGIDRDDANIAEGDIFFYAGEGEEYISFPIYDSQAVEDTQFGSAIDIFEDLVIVGAPGQINEQGFNSGLAHIFRYHSQERRFEYLAKLSHDENIENNTFGKTVSISGNYAVVGTGLREDGAANQDLPGAIYVFQKTGGNWSFMQKMEDTEPGPENREFGTLAAIEARPSSNDGDVPVLLAPANSKDPGANPHKLYIYHLINGAWVKKGHSYTPDYPIASIALTQDQAYLGMIGKAQRIEGIRQNGDLMNSLNGTDYFSDIIPDELEKAQFGASIAIDEYSGTIAVGAPRFGGNREGKVYIYNRSSGYYPTQVLFRGIPSQHFGNFLAFGRKLLIVGGEDSFSIFTESLGGSYILNKSDHRIWTALKQGKGFILGADIERKISLFPLKKRNSTEIEGDMAIPNGELQVDGGIYGQTLELKKYLSVNTGAHIEGDINLEGNINLQGNIITDGLQLQINSDRMYGKALELEQHLKVSHGVVPNYDSGWMPLEEQLELPKQGFQTQQDLLLCDFPKVEVFIKTQEGTIYKIPLGAGAVYFDQILGIEILSGGYFYTVEGDDKYIIAFRQTILLIGNARENMTPINRDDPNLQVRVFIWVIPEYQTMVL